MSRYIAYVVQRDGVQRYLIRATKLTDWSKSASHYPHPSAARRALDSFLRKHPRLGAITGLIDSRDPERVVV